MNTLYIIPKLLFLKIFESTKSLRIGYYFDDGYTKASPACVRAVEVAKMRLELAGHTLVPLKVPDIDKAMKLATESK